MRFLFKAKDGGEESKVTGYWLIESKRFFSIVLLRFDGDSREAYHEHAFNSWAFVLKGELFEEFLGPEDPVVHKAWGKPFIIGKSSFHKVSSKGVSWVLNIRGPWEHTWREYLPNESRMRTLTNGRIEVLV